MICEFLRRIPTFQLLYEWHQLVNTAAHLLSVQNRLKSGRCQQKAQSCPRVFDFDVLRAFAPQFRMLASVARIPHVWQACGTQLFGWNRLGSGNGLNVNGARFHRKLLCRGRSGNVGSSCKICFSSHNSSSHFCIGQRQHIAHTARAKPHTGSHKTVARERNQRLAMLVALRDQCAERSTSRHSAQPPSNRRTKSQLHRRRTK